MDKTTNELLEEVIQKQLAKLNVLDVDDENYGELVDNTTKLLDKRIKVEELDLKNAQVLGAQELEEQLKTQELAFKKSEQEHDKKKVKWENVLKVVGYGVTLTGLAVTVGTKVWGTKYTLNYEDKGVIPTTESGRNFVKDLFRS